MNWKSEGLALAFGMLIILMVFGDATQISWVGNLEYKNLSRPPSLLQKKNFCSGRLELSPQHQSMNYCFLHHCTGLTSY
jgi:hypothetical protein